MAASQNPHQISARALRQIGWVAAIALAATGQLIGPSLVALWLQLAGAAVFAVATVRPSALRALFAFVAFLARPLGWMTKSRTPARQRRVVNSGV